MLKAFLKRDQEYRCGCLQVNLRYHGSSFESTEEALEPDKNIAYAAWYLKDLRLQHGSWSKAIARYHSANRKYHNPYRIKVYKMWARTPA